MSFDWEVIIKTAMRDRCDLRMSNATLDAVKESSPPAAPTQFGGITPNFGDPLIYVSVDMPDDRVTLIDRRTLNPVAHFYATEKDT